MKKYLYTTGAVALAIAMSGAPALALAENQGSEQEVSQVRPVTAPVLAGSTTAQRPSIVGSSEEENESANLEGAEHAKLPPRIRALFAAEGTTTPVFSLAALKQSIEQRKHELEQEEASSTPDEQKLVKDTNPVRLAVHSLLASKDLLGGIGQQVSEIAKHMNDSVATTTAAEAQIQSRGFFARFLFGGDKNAATTIADQVAQNQKQIDNLTALLGQANISADVQATLTAQITALKDAQTRLQNLAQKEKKAWGLFSWRF